MKVGRRAVAGLLPALRVLGKAALACVFALLVAILVFRATPATTWVDPARFVRPRDAVEVVDRHGLPLRHDRVNGVDRRWVKLAEISPSVVDAFIATEDARFREHAGVDLRASARGALSLLRPWTRRSGGSTITQQLVKLVYGRPLGAASVASKVVEIVRAVALERVFTKDEILEQYLNRVPFGDRIEGVGRASEAYFGVSAARVDLGQAAMLAGIPQAPSATEPRRHLARALRRRDLVLSRLAALGFIDGVTRARLAADPPRIRETPARPNEAPRFTDRALARYRHGDLARHEDVVATSLDLELERAAQAILADAVARFSGRGVTNGAAIVVANATGEVVAYVGALPHGPGSSLDLLRAKRQPGSSLKPFAYELLFERGGTAATVLDDIALPRLGAHGSTFEARDYDGTERGPVRARVALSASLNLAALDAAGRVGQVALVKRLHALDIAASDDAERYGAAAVLGGLDVAPIDLAAAYVTLARGGTRVPLAFARSADAAPRPGVPLLDPAAVEVTIDVLRDGRARADAFGQSLEDVAGGRFALKTGTSSGYRDVWASVFDDALTVVVWMGDPGGTPLAGVSGFEAAAPAAARILAAARARAETDGVAPFERPRVALVTVAVCAQTGLRPGPRCHHVVDERFAKDTAPLDACDGHDEHGDLSLPPRYAAWIERVRPAGVARAPLAVAASEDAPIVREPRDGARWLVDANDGGLEVPLRASVPSGEVTGATWEVDGQRLAGAAWNVAPGDHEIVAIWRGRRSTPARVHVATSR